MKMFFSLKMFRYGLISKESAIVILAFTLTVGAYGFIILNFLHVSSPTTSSSQFVVESILLNYRDGHVWRVVIPLSSKSPAELRLSSLDVRLLVNGERVPVMVNNVIQTGGGRLVLGSLLSSLASGKVLVGRVSSGLTASESVDLFVYIDQGGKLNVVIDDDSDNVLDDSYLIIFQSNVSAAYELNPQLDAVLSVGKGVTLPISYLDFMAVFSARPNPYVEVVHRDVTYYVGISDVLVNLYRAVLMIWVPGNDLRLDPGERAYLILLVPSARIVGGVDFSIELLVNGELVFSKSLRLPQGLSGSGTLIMS